MNLTFNVDECRLFDASVPRLQPAPNDHIKATSTLLLSTRALFPFGSIV